MPVPPASQTIDVGCGTAILGCVPKVAKRLMSLKRCGETLSLLLAAAALTSAATTLDIYHIDVEGGAATLIVTVVASHGERITKPINGGAANDALCKDAQLKQPDPTDNARSAGFLLSYGKFQFLDLGDLTWNKEHALACPQNMIGAVDLYQV